MSYRSGPGASDDCAGAGSRRLRRALLVAGPTCSGKSGLALHLAERLGGTVINADSMQVYRELPLLTAQPGAADRARAPHWLYGVRDAAEPGSVAWWRSAALEAMEAAHAGGRLPILCGGTGLYLAALTQGIAPVPEPGVAAREEARHLLAELGSVALHARLVDHDPGTAALLRPSDGQRIARAWEVWRGTGRGLAAWQAVPAEPSAWEFRLVLLDPPRDALRAAIATRFSAMLEQGAIEEVRALLDRGLDAGLPAMRALGVRELLAFLEGVITLSEAERRAVMATGQYTRRQATWFRHRSPVPAASTHMIHSRFAERAQFSEREWHAMERFIRSSG